MVSSIGIPGAWDDPIPIAGFGLPEDCRPPVFTRAVLSVLYAPCRSMPLARFGLLIFDLDDTLLDTYGQLIEPAIREACEAMIEAGLNADLESCISQRKELFLRFPRRDVYRGLIEHFGVRSDREDDRIWEAGYRAFYHRKVDPGIRVFDGAYALLDRLRRDYELHLVTSGGVETQQRKVSILKLEPYFVSVTYVDSSQTKSKEAAFRKILAASDHDTDRTLCIGDRLDREIRDANRIGMTTCQVHYGEFQHLEPCEPDEYPDHRIGHIRELLDYLSD